MKVSARAPTTIFPNRLSCPFFSPVFKDFYVATNGSAAANRRPRDPRKEAAPNSANERETVSFEGKTIDFGTLELRTERNTIQLTLMEAKLLRHLIHNKGRNVSRKSILEDVWGLSEDTDTRAIDNFIVRLRKYIEKNPAKPRHLLTVRGVGYRFVA